MSGGYWENKEYILDEMANDIESIIEKNNKIIPYEKLDSWDQRAYDFHKAKYEQNPRYYYGFGDKTIEEFKNAVRIFRKARVYANRIDYLLECDDGEDSFHRRLQRELGKCAVSKEYISDCGGKAKLYGYYSQDSYAQVEFRFDDEGWRESYLITRLEYRGDDCSKSPQSIMDLVDNINDDFYGSRYCTKEVFDDWQELMEKNDIKVENE